MQIRTQLLYFKKIVFLGFLTSAHSRTGFPSTMGLFSLQIFEYTIAIGAGQELQLAQLL